METEKSIWKNLHIEIVTGYDNGVWIRDVEKNQSIGHLTDGQLIDIIKTLIIEKVI